MSDHQEYGMVYHIDFELLKKSREMDIKKRIEKIETQIGNAEQDLQLLTVAERALYNIQTVLEQMREIVVEITANPNANRKKLNKKFEAYKEQINEIVKSATYNGVNLIDGSMGNIRDIIAAIDATLK